MQSRMCVADIQSSSDLQLARRFRPAPLNWHVPPCISWPGRKIFSVNSDRKAPFHRTKYLTLEYKPPSSNLPNVTNLQRLIFALCCRHRKRISPYIAMGEDEQTVGDIVRCLPKVQLHLHLDGSISEDLIAAHAKARNVTLPTSPASLRDHLLSAKQKSETRHSFVQDRNSNWDIFNFCNSFLQTSIELTHATKTVTQALVSHNVWIAEIRFCPALHTSEGLTLDEVVAAVVHGFKSVEATHLPYGLRGGIIICALRSYDQAHVAEMAGLARRWRGRGVIGLDLAGDEGTYPLSLHKPALQKAVSDGIPLTVHAGEWGEHGLENVSVALDIGVQRIGHGLVLRESESSCRELVRRNVFLETCITANCNSERKVPPGRFDLHPVKCFLERGVRVAAFNCDNLLLSGTRSFKPDPTEEIVRARLRCGLTWRQVAQVLVDGVRASFDETVCEGDGRFLQLFEKEVMTVLQPFIQAES